MADTVTPSSSNPYLALLQQEAKPPGWAQILQHIGNLGFGLAGGFGQAATTGQPTMAGIGPGLMMGNQINAQAAHQAEQERMKRLQFGMQAEEWDEKRKLRAQQQAAIAEYMKGFNVTPSQGPLMGPAGAPPQGGGYDTRVAGLEGGTKKGGMVFNELGSGAFGPYQFMPATWAAVRAQNPSLNLPADITQATREQHDAAHGAFKAGNAQGLQTSGFQPTPENLYLAHRFGLGGALAVLRADPDKPLAEVLPADWQRQNPDMRGQTAGGFRRLAAERVGGSSVPYVVRQDAKPTPYSLMPDDVPFSLFSTDTTLPRPRTAEPTFTAPVMPQPTWEKPGDVVPVMPQPQWPTVAPQSPGAAALPQVPAGATMQPPPQGDQVTAGGSPVDPNAQPPPFMQTGGGGQPAGTGPGPVQPNYTPQRSMGQPPLAPPTVPPPTRADLPPDMKRELQLLAASGDVTKLAATERQMIDAVRAQRQTQADKAWERQWTEYGHSRGQSEEEVKRQIAKLEDEMKFQRDLGYGHKPMINIETGKFENVPKGEQGNPKYLPPEASVDEINRAKLELDKRKTEADIAQTAVDPATGRPRQGVVDAKAAAAAAEAEARARVEQRTKPALQFATDEAKRFSETVQPGAEAAANGLTNLYEMKRLTEGNMATGPGIDQRMFTARLLDTLGIKDMPQGMVNTTEYLNRASKGVISVLQTGALGKTQISEGDRKFVEQMAAKDVGYTKQELQKLVDVAIDASHKTLDQHGKGADRISRILGPDFKDYVKIDRQTYEEWKKDNPVPGQQGTFPAPTDAHIKHLQMNPSLKADFDQKFGPGAAERVLKR